MHAYHSAANLLTWRCITDRRRLCGHRNIYCCDRCVFDLVSLSKLNESPLLIVVFGYVTPPSPPSLIKISTDLLLQRVWFFLFTFSSIDRCCTVESFLRQFAPDTASPSAQHLHHLSMSSCIFSVRLPSCVHIHITYY